jgi:NAD-dependent dihydropyrimidine dehydrogenase PreA subunit/flavodoxin
MRDGESVMVIRTVWGVYFSATGTTEKIVNTVANTIAKKLGAEHKSYSYSLPDARLQSLVFSKEDFVVFGAPVYAGRIPNLMLPFIKDKISGNGTLATPVTLFGNRSYDDSLIELRDILQINGFHTISAGAFVGEHSFSTVLGAGRPDGDDFAQAVRLGEATAEIILSVAEPPKNAVRVAGNEPVRPYYVPQDRYGNPINILKVKPKADMSKCVNCGTCAALCTMGSINPVDVGDVCGVCIKCCACVKRCPTNARYFDDEGFLYHRSELEEVYTRRASVELFF